jgi:ubiquinone biosynthesis protein COQ9
MKSAIIPPISDIVNAMLPHVPFDGWTEKAFHRACDQLNIPYATLWLLGEHGIADIVTAYLAMLDDALEAHSDLDQLATMKVRERIAALVRWRLMMHAEQPEIVRKALLFFAHPQYVCLGTQALWHTADTIWYLAGDRATDYNHYSKRILLSGVYSSTLLYWLQDDSENYERSWQFLAQRIEEVLRLGKTIHTFITLPTLAENIPFVRLWLRKRRKAATHKF